MYNWQLEDFPNFQYDLESLQERLYQFSENNGILYGSTQHLDKSEREKITLDLLVTEAIKTSAIEGEYLSREDIFSSVRRELGLDKSKHLSENAKAKGIAELMCAARNDYTKDLTHQLLYSWHTSLLGYIPQTRIAVGKYRTHEEPMQIISGVIGKIKIHFEAPPSKEVPELMNRFISWFNTTKPGNKNELIAAPVRAAIAHLYFESIHPFEDGNGRIGRALSEMCLSQSLGYPVIISLSTEIEKNRKKYYAALKSGQCSNDINEWINYFCDTLLNAQIYAKKVIEFSLTKAKFFDQHQEVLNDRQLKAINRMFDAGPEGFEGGMTAKKYMSLVRCSKATATRDLTQLAQNNILISIDGGRSAHYHLNI